MRKTTKSALDDARRERNADGKSVRKRRLYWMKRIWIS